MAPDVTAYIWSPKYWTVARYLVKENLVEIYYSVPLRSFQTRFAVVPTARTIMFAIFYR